MSFERLERGRYRVRCTSEGCGETVDVDAPGTKEAVKVIRGLRWLHNGHLTHKLTLCPAHAKERRDATKRKRRREHPFSATKSAAGQATRRAYLDKLDAEEGG